MRTLEFTLTQEHISKGIRKDCENCPITICLRELHPEALAIWTGPKSISILYGDFDPRSGIYVFSYLQRLNLNHYDFGGNLIEGPWKVNERV